MTQTTFQRARRKAARTFLLAGSVVLGLQLARAGDAPAAPRVAVEVAHHAAAASPAVAPGWRVVTTTCPALGSVERTYRNTNDVYGLQESSMLQTYWVAWAQHHPGVFSSIALWHGPTLISAGAGDCAFAQPFATRR